jgi:phosphoribosyl 1,2-cyclic phosphodiesterase
MKKEKIIINFWGVRGSAPCPGKYFMKYGGNTACVHIQIGRTQLVFDAGTGIIPLGQDLTKKGKSIDGNILLSHLHWDHIHGLPFFEPFYDHSNSFKIYGKAKELLSLEKAVTAIMKNPYYPIGWYDMKAKFKFVEIDHGPLDFGYGISVETININHPGGCLGYKLKYNNNIICYLTDMEYSGNDNILENFVSNSDILICDGQYTDEEYYGCNGHRSRRGWGHTSWQNAITLGDKGNVRLLLLFHHDIYRRDEELDIIGAEAKAKGIITKVNVSYEGLQLEL